MKSYKFYKKMLTRFSDLLGREVQKLLLISIVMGLLWFVVEIMFLGVFQVFLYSIELISADQLKLPFPIPRSIVLAASILFLYGIIRSLALFFRQFYAGIIAQSYIRRHREALFRFALQNSKLEAIHQLNSVYTERINQTGLAIQNLSSVLASFFAILALFVIGLRLAPQELLIGILALFIMLLPFRKIGASLAGLGSELMTEWNGVNKLMMIGFKNQFFLKIYGGIEALVESGVGHLRQTEKVYIRYIGVNAFKSTLPFAYGLLIISLLSIASREYFNRDGITIVAFFYVFMRMAQGAGEVNTGFNEIRFHSHGFTDVYRWHLKAKRFLSQEKRQINRSIKKQIENIKFIEAKNVGFGYSGKPLLFNNLNFTIHKGQALLIKGESGVGKSSLVSVLIGLHSAREGQVFYNNLAVNDYHASYLNYMAYVGPEPYIIPGSVRENLLFGHHHPEQVSDEMIWKALDIAAVRNDIQKLSRQLNENLLENAQLSSGQKQRISIARAFLREPDLLVLDEATANLDIVTEAQVLKNIEAHKKDLILIIVSHKSSFDSLADIKIILSGSLST